MRYWKTVKSGMATRRDVTAATTVIREELPKELVPTTNLRKTSQKPHTPGS